MQDRYAGDLGDFLTFGLLRWLVPQHGGAAPRLAVVWYLTADESHNGDGRHVAYLRDHHAVGRRLRRLDIDLYERLATVVGGPSRSVAALESAGVLCATTRYVNDVLHVGDLPVTARDDRLARRSGWLRRAIDATAGCDLVFVDPDNGIRSAQHPVGRHRNTSVKYAYLDELAGFARRGQSVIAYQHADRSGPVQDQAARRLDQLAAEVPVQPLAAVRASRGSARLFLVGAATATHDAFLGDRLTALEQSHWRGELIVYWYR